MGKIFIKAVALDSASNTLYVINGDTNNLLKVDQNTGQSTVVGHTELTSINGLVYDSATTVPGEELLGFDYGSRQFFYLDPTTGVGTRYPAPAISNGIATDLAIDTSTAGAGTLYAIAGNGFPQFEFTTIDRVTKTLGARIQFRDTAGTLDSSMRSLMIDSTGEMYGITQHNGCSPCLAKINKTTGLVTNLNGLQITSADSKIGFGVNSPAGIDKGSNTAYAADFNTGQLVSVDLGTGVGTMRGGTITSLDNIVYSASDNTTYAMDFSFTNRLYSINPANGHTTYITNWDGQSTSAVNGFAVNPNSPSFYSSIDGSPASLSTFDTSASLALTPLNMGAETLSSVLDLSWNSTLGTLFGLSKNTNRLFQITDIATGAGTYKGPTIGTNLYRSLVYNATNQIFITIDNETSLLTIDANSGGALNSIPLTGDLPALYAVSAQP